MAATITAGEMPVLRPGCRVINTLASTQDFPFLTAEWYCALVPVNGHLLLRLRQMLLTLAACRVVERLEGGSKAATNLCAALVPISAAADGYLQAAALHYPSLTFDGMFPGIVVTDLAASTFPA